MKHVEFIGLNILVPLAIGTIASILATIITNKRISSEEIIKKKIIDAIRVSLLSCGDSKALIGFDEEKLKKSIAVWQEYKNRLISIIKTASSKDIKIEPAMFAIEKSITDFTGNGLSTYIQFCDTFIHNFSNKFVMDKEYIDYAVMVETPSMEKREERRGIDEQ